MQNFFDTEKMKDVSDLFDSQIFINKTQSGENSLVVRLYREGVYDGMAFDLPPEMTEDLLKKMEIKDV